MTDSGILELVALVREKADALDQAKAHRKVCENVYFAAEEAERQATEALHQAQRLLSEAVLPRILVPSGERSAFSGGNS